MTLHALNLYVHQIYILLFHNFEKFNLNIYVINFPYILIVTSFFIQFLIEW